MPATSGLALVQGETVPYIICVELGEDGQQKESTGGLADRAYHRDELAANPNLRVDVEYYLSNQVCVSSISAMHSQSHLQVSRCTRWCCTCVRQLRGGLLRDWRIA